MEALSLKALWLMLNIALCQDAHQPGVISEQWVAEARKAPISPSTTDLGKIFACPRCRRAEPKGPKKRPSPRQIEKSESESEST